MTITITISGRCSTGRISDPLDRDAADRTRTPSVSANAGQYETPWFISDQAT